MAPTSSQESSDSESVKVFCRVRPPVFDSERSAPLVVEPFDRKQVIVHNDDGANQSFAFDRVFDDTVEQQVVFKESVEPNIYDLTEGKNLAILAYGQTGSGKTHTMMGDEEHPGIIPLACEKLFKEVNQVHTDRPDVKIRVQAAFIEVYMEHVLDLLNPKRLKCSLNDVLKENRKSNEKLQILQDRDRGLTIRNAIQVIHGFGVTAVDVVVKVPVTSAEEVMRVFERGNRARATANTKSNEYSSRSHALVLLTITRMNSSTCQTSYGQFYMCDLAGSERVAKTKAKGMRMSEANKINASLLTLGSVISALTSTKESHVPYRDSKLTRLLQNALGGNGRTAIICTVSPSSLHAQETISTLRFGVRSQAIKNVVRVNMVQRTTKELEVLLLKAEKELAAYRDQMQDVVNLRNEKVRCPLTKESFVDPVIAGDGVTYERSAIINFFKIHGLVSPGNHSQTLDDDRLIPNKTLQLLLKPDDGDDSSTDVKASPIDKLPYEVLLRVFRFLGAVDIGQCSGVNRRWWRVAQDETLWEPLLQSLFRKHGQRSQRKGLPFRSWFIQEYNIIFPRKWNWKKNVHTNEVHLFAPAGRTERSKQRRPCVADQPQEQEQHPQRPERRRLPALPESSVTSSTQLLEGRRRRSLPLTPT